MKETSLLFRRHNANHPAGASRRACDDSHKTETATVTTDWSETTQLLYRKRETSSRDLVQCRRAVLHAFRAFRKWSWWRSSFQKWSWLKIPVCITLSTTVLSVTSSIQRLDSPALRIPLPFAWPIPAAS